MLKPVLNCSIEGIHVIRERELANVSENDGAPLLRGRRDFAEVRTRLNEWLARRLPELGDLAITRLEAPASGGVANETLLIETTCANGPGPGLVVRPEGEPWLYPGVTLDLHHEMYVGVHAAGTVPTPAILAFEDDPSVLGQRFLLMERMPGQAAPDRPNFNEAGWLRDLPEAERETVWHGAVGAIAALHAIEASRFPLLCSRAAGKPGLQAAIDYWVDYARWCDRLEHPLISAALVWLERNCPVGLPSSLSWGDARLQNLMFDGTRCTALLDWDLVSLAGAEADLAWWALADHKQTASRGRPRLAGIGSPASTIRLWESLAGRKTVAMDWHLVFASLRQALIAFRLDQAALLRGEAAAPEPAIGLQWLACLLELPLGQKMTLPFVGLEY
ncbi:MAG: phosphotransferase family protein [Steroidobacteraceae bacterium]